MEFYVPYYMFYTLLLTAYEYIAVDFCNLSDGMLDGRYGGFRTILNSML